MIAVADTSPLCYLVLIAEVELLHKLFSQVVVPTAVVTELLHEDAPRHGPRLGGQSPALDFRSGESGVQPRRLGETSGW